MPKSPIESFFDKVFDAVDEAAADLVRDASKQAKENIRRMSRQLDRAAIANPPVRPVTSGRKRAQEQIGRAHV